MTAIQDRPAWQSDLSRFDERLHAIQNPLIRSRLVQVILDALLELEEDVVDVVVLAARRMTCLYSLLLEAGMPLPARGVVISDRFLDLQDPRRWKWKRIRLLDDTVVSGQTMRHRQESIRRLVPHGLLLASEVALNLSSEKVDWSEYFPTSLPAKNLHASEGLHNQFAQAFGENLIPYFTDFPISQTLKISAAQFDDLLNAGGWRTVDVTSSALAGSGNRAFSLFPTKELAANFSTHVNGADVVADVIKIRVFSADDGSYVRLRVVPLVLMRPVHRESVAALYKRFGLTLGSHPNQFGQAVGLLSYALSRALLSVFADSAHSLLGAELVEDAAFARLILGTDLEARIATPLNEYFPTFHTLTEEPVSDRLSTELSLRSSGFDYSEPLNYVVLGDDVTDPSFYAIKALADAVSQGTSSWSEVAATLSSLSDISESNLATTSLAIDVLNDLGYAVPTYYLRDSLVVRGYRPGESSMHDLEPVAGKLGGRLASLLRTLDVMTADDETVEVRTVFPEI